MAVDSLGVVHVVYGDTGLYHAAFDGSAWNIGRIAAAPGAGKAVTMAVAPDDSVHVLYRYWAPGESSTECPQCLAARYVRLRDGQWEHFEVPAEYAESFPAPPRIVVDTSGVSHFLGVRSFLGQDYLYEVTRSADGTWRSSQLAVPYRAQGISAGHSFAAQLAPDGKIHAVRAMNLPDTGQVALQHFVKVPGHQWSAAEIARVDNADYASSVALAISANGVIDTMLVGRSRANHYRIGVDGVISGTVLEGISGVWHALAVYGGVPQLVHMTNEGVIKHARLEGNTWVLEQGPATVPPEYTYPELEPLNFVTLPNGSPLVLTMARWNSSPDYYVGSLAPRSLMAWTRDLGWSGHELDVSTNRRVVPGKDLHALLDGGGQLHVFHFVDHETQPTGWVDGVPAHTFGSGSRFETELLPRGSRAFALDRDGTLHSVGYDNAPTLRHWWRDSDVWFSEDIGAVGYLVGPITLNADARGTLHGCFADERYASNGSRYLRINYVTNAGGIWAQHAVEDIAHYVWPSVAYYGSGVDNLRCDVRELTSGDIVMGYIDSAYSIKKAVLGSSGVWQTATLWKNDFGEDDHVADPRIFLKPAVSAEGHLHVVYTNMHYNLSANLDWSGRGIGYGTDATGIWQSEIVDDNVMLGGDTRDALLFHPALALAPDGSLYVSYFDIGSYLKPGNGQLRVAIRTQGAWRNGIIDAESRAGRWHTPVVMADGSVSYVYSNDAAATLKLASTVDAPALFLTGEKSTSADPGAIAKLPLSVRNFGQLSLQMYGMQIADPFYLVPELDHCTGIVLEPQGECSLEVEFRPSLGSGGATTRRGLAINSNDPNAELVFQLTGKSNRPAATTGRSSGSSGGGAISWRWLTLLVMLTVIRRHRAGSVCG